MRVILTLLVVVVVVGWARELQQKWTIQTFPHLRGSTHRLCGNITILDHTKSATLICDPDRILSSEEATSLNVELNKVAQETTCHCERKVDCLSFADSGDDLRVGSIILIALLKDISIQSGTARESLPQPVLIEQGQRFVKGLHRNWAIGDCDNAVVVLLWEKERMVFLSAGKTTRPYLTDRDKDRILSSATTSELLQARKYASALDELVVEISSELRGSADSRIDTGTIVLIVSIGIAFSLLCIVTGCVCAFRCCGKYADPDSMLGRTFSRVDSIKHEVVRRGTIIRQSFSMPRGRTSAKISTVSRLSRPSVAADTVSEEDEEAFNDDAPNVRRARKHASAPQRHRQNSTNV